MFSYKDKTEALQIAVNAGFITLEVAQEEMRVMLGYTAKNENNNSEEPTSSGGVGFFMPSVDYNDDISSL